MWSSPVLVRAAGVTDGRSEQSRLRSVHTTQIEQQLTILLRRVQSIHLVTSDGAVELDRSAYGIMCRLADEGPSRLGVLAQAFGLDPSTITRQVQSLEAGGFVQRTTDPTDRRASILALSEVGSTVLQDTREYRRNRLREVLADWSDADREELGRVLEKFNASLDELVQAQT